MPEPSYNINPNQSQPSSSPVPTNQNPINQNQNRNSGQLNPQVKPFQFNQDRKSFNSPNDASDNKIINDIDVRTMKSDIDSIQNSGGGLPQAYTPKIQSTNPDIKKDSSPFVRPVPPSSMPTVNIPPVYPVSQIPARNNITKPPMPPIQGMKSIGGAKKPKKGIFMMIIVLLIVAGAGAIIYLFVLPLITGKNQSQNNTTTEPPPPSDENIFPNVPLPTDDLVQEPENVSTGTESNEPILEVPVITQALVHKSFLKTPADVSSEIILDNIDLETLKNRIGFTTAEITSLKEIILKDSKSNIIVFSDLGKLLSPTLFTNEVNNLFEPDFTLLVFTDSKGSWPIYVLKSKPEIELSKAKDKVKQIENLNTQELGNFFLTEPGEKAIWKDGQLNGKASRYLSFSKNGTAINYVWLDNYLLIGSNYDGVKEVAKRLAE